MKESFIKTMRNLAYPVCIASTKYNKNQYAITVSSVTSVSLDPPSLLVCISKKSPMIESIQTGSHLNINFLGSTQKEIASICSSKERVNERYDNDLWADDDHNIPYLKKSEAIALSKVANVVDHATHIIAILYVHKVILNNKGQPDPMLYCNGAYIDIKLPVMEKAK